MKKLRSILIIIFAVLFAFSSVFAQLTKEEKRAKRKASRKLLKEVILSFEESQYADVLSLADSLLVVDPHNADAFYYKSLALTKTSDTVSALKAIENGIVEVPLSSRLKILASRIYLNLRESDKALVHLESILKIKPKEAETLYLSGLVYLQKADTAQALELFDKSLQYSLSGK